VAQDHLPQCKHFCYWELTFANSYRLNWWEAIRYSKMLFKESSWSKSTYAYQVAALMCMVKDELTEEQKLEQIEMMM
jgi:hypothetical protein